MDELLQQGITAFRAGQRDEARKIFIAVIKQYPENDRAWGWMYNVSDNDKERIYCLKQMLRINPQNEKAKQLLDTLTGNDFPFEPPQNIAPPIQTQRDIVTPVSQIEKFTASQKAHNPSQVNSLKLAANEKKKKPVVAKKANKRSVILLAVLGLLGFVIVVICLFLPTIFGVRGGSINVGKCAAIKLTVCEIDGGFATVKGQVTNSCDFELRYVKIISEVYSQSGTLRDSDPEYVENIAPSQTKIFESPMINPQGDATNCKAHVEEASK